MRAQVMTGHGGPEKLSYRHDVAVPDPQTGFVRVAVTASSVNNTDIWTREGAYGTRTDPTAVSGWRGVPIEVPRIQGADGVGFVDALGPASKKGPLLGRRVLIDPAIYETDGPADGGPGSLAHEHSVPVGLMGSEFDGAFAEYVVVRADRVHDVTSSPLSDRELAALPTAYGTAMGMLVNARAAEGEALVVTGASGGVGVGLVQIGVALGLRVTAVSTLDKTDDLHALGASHVVDRGSNSLAADVEAAVGGPVDLVADVVGGETFAIWPGLLRSGGRIVVAGAVAGPHVTIDLRRLYLDQRRIIGSSMHGPAAFARLVELANDGAFRPAVGATFDLSELPAAQLALRDRSTIGKVVIDVS